VNTTTKATTARIHHWVSQAYLARFTETGDEDSNLFAVDLLDRKTFTPSPRNVCAKRDFNTISSPDLAPDDLERSLAEFETLADRALDEVTKNARAFSPRAWLTVVNFMALLAVRNPLSRKFAEEIYTEHLLRDLDEATNTPEKFEATVAAARASGDLSSDLEVDYERHRNFLDGRRFKMTFDPGFHVVGEFKTVDSVLRHLVDRQWLLLEAPQESAGFVTTDRPVTLCFSDGSPPSDERPMGFAVKDTMVLFPLSPRFLAVGTFSGQDGVARVSRDLVARVNFTMVRQCERRIFAPRDDFEVELPGKRGVVVGAGVLDVIGERVTVKPYKLPK
jgi:hypothetical protein